MACTRLNQYITLPNLCIYSASLVNEQLSDKPTGISAIQVSVRENQHLSLTTSLGSLVAHCTVH